MLIAEEWPISIMPSPSYFLPKNPPKYPLNRRPYGPWSRSECLVEEENLLLLQGIETQFFRCPTLSLITVLIILPQLLDRPKQKCNFPLQNQDL